MKKHLLLMIFFSVLMLDTYAQKFYQIRWQNRPRNYIVYLPQNFSISENLPLVINMHGFLTTAQFQMDYTQFNRIADSVRSIVVYPEGVDLRWNSGAFFFVASDVDDVGFLADLMDRMAVLYNADMKKVFSIGYSAGGFMSYKLACDLTNRITAIAPDVASMVFDNLNSCVPTRAMNIAAFNGLSDPITPYNGIFGNFPSIDSIKHFWQIKNGCDVSPLIDTLPDLKNDETRVVRYTYQNCNQAVGQVFYKVINGGHVWPGADNVFLDILGKTTQDISLNEEAWNFFKTKEIPATVRCDAPINMHTNAVTIDSFMVHWDAVADVLKYKVAVIDDSDRITFYETMNTSLGIKVSNPLKQNKWNVASLCASGYHNWNLTRVLNNITTTIRIDTTQKISIFPNPCKDEIYIDFPKTTSSITKLAIYNFLGDEVFLFVSSDNKIDVSNLAKGWYQLSITAGDKNYTSSFLKQ